MKTDDNKDRFVNCLRSVTPRSQAGRVLFSVLILVVGTVSWGCGGVVSGQSGQISPPPPTTYSISGTIGPATGGSGATLTLSGAASATVTATSAGAYSFAGLANGTYMVTPSQAGYNFTPSNQSVTVNGANVSGINFTSTAQNGAFNISGTITPAAGGSGATVTLSGAGTATTTADSSGAYTFAGLANGTYAVTPSKAGYTFSPTSQNAIVNGANVTGINFTSTPQTNTFTITGTITPTAGGSGATVMLSGPAAATTTADTSGSYSFTGLPNGTYTVTPSNTGYTFSPVSQSVTVNGANQTGVNFTAAPQQSHTVALSWTASTTTTVSGYNVYRSTTNGSGYAKINSSLVTVLTYTDSTVLSGATYYYVTTAVDSTGAESGYSNQATAAIP